MNPDTNSISRASDDADGLAKCRARVGHGWHRVQCARRATQDGYCGTHHPDAVKRRREKSEAHYTAKNAAFIAKLAAAKEQRRRAERYDGMLAALKQFATCDLHAGNCASLEVATARIRGIARRAIAEAEAYDARTEATRQHATKSTDAEVDSGNSEQMD